MIISIDKDEKDEKDEKDCGCWKSPLKTFTLPENFPNHNREIVKYYLFFK